ncbi:Hypothetical protein A7982_05845 [Minicystis rosea]|nr:Hypothetical protein A7982_05845 [Minicystis rosea]
MKVTVRRIQTGVAAASTLLVATGALGCADEGPDGGESIDIGSQAVNPGSARLELQLGGAGALDLLLTQSTTDEFVRVGETLDFALPAWLLWETLYPNDGLPDDTRLAELRATVKVSFFDKSTTLSSKTLTISTFNPTQSGLYAYTTELVVPQKTDTIKLTLTIKDAADTTKSITLGQSSIREIPVFGGDLPNKTLFFDNDAGVLRHRVVDGELLVHGSTVTLGYADWRADQIVDKTSLDLQIGTATFNGRFGQYQAPIYGTLKYIVSYGISFDGGQTFQTEKALTGNTASRLVSAGRTAYEGTESIPAAANEIQLYGHVKAYLVADYSKYQNVSAKWYGDNEEVLKKDAYDNPSGAFSNYVLPLQ